MAIEQGSEMHIGGDTEVDAPVVDPNKVTITGRTDGGAGDAPEVTERKAYAKTLGWEDNREEWAARNPGREHLWRDHEAFIKYGEANRPVLIGEVRKLSTQLTERDREIAQLRADNAEIKQFMENTGKAIRERKKEAIRAQMKAAREANDFDAEMALSSELIKLEAPAAPAREEQRPPQPEVTEFLKANPWYGDGPEADPALTYEATEIAKGLAARGIKGRAMLDNMLRVMKARFPENFKANGNGQGDDHRGAAGNGRGSAVDGGQFSSGQQHHRGKAPTFANLPDDAKKAALDFERKHKVSKEAYAANWFKNQGEQS